MICDEMSTFHPFPRLPFELRAQIWEETVKPRVVRVEVAIDHLDNSYLKTSTPAPAPLHACQEARNARLYQKSFTELANPNGAGQQYVWLNLDIDVISIGRTQTPYYKPVAHLIQRLRFERVYVPFTQAYKLLWFDNLKELHIVAVEGLWRWNRDWERIQWRCGHENIWMIDPDDGRTIKAVEMSKIFDADQNCHRKCQREPNPYAKELIPFVLSQAEG
jgi:hypothetical protein